MIIRRYKNRVIVLPIAEQKEDQFMQTQVGGKIEFIKIKNSELPYARYQYLKVIDSTLPLSLTNIEPDTDAIIAKDTEYRFTRLEKIFTEKWLGIKRIIINKPYMQDEKAINAQIESYDKLGFEAKLQLENDPDNVTLQAIVNKWEESRNISFNANLLTQQIRSVLESKIESNDVNVDELLDIAYNVKLTKEQFTDPAKLTELKEMFTGI